MVIRSFLENDFDATLSSKTNVLSVWKEHFPGYCKFLIDKVETVFWESETEPSRSFKFKDDHRKLFEKWFWSNLGIKNECFEHLEREIFSFLQFLSDEVETIFRESEILNQNLAKRCFLENGLEASLSSRTNIVGVWK